MAAPLPVRALAQSVIVKAAAKKLMVATAESCTGGMIGAALTDIAGSSAVYERGFITYSNEAKTELLGVPMPMIVRHGAVSGEVAREMAKGATLKSRADIAVAVTGVAGPDGGTPDKPVGLVWFGLATRSGVLRIERRVFAGGSRDFVRMKTVETALRLILSAI
ncbi:MAG TPA: CinA family protein [Parvularculaceae bacterium]|nr:CinA family protein [Parvularculaceae bacterium]